MVPLCGYSILQTSVPEAMCVVSGENHVSKINNWQDAQAIGIGPGIGTHEYTIKAFDDFIEAVKQPIVIDADALNILAKQPDLMHKIPAGSILTPHPKEFERMFGKTPNSMLQVEHARTQAMRYNVFVVLKGRHTAIATPDGECWYCTDGNAGMATGGSGDVLTGILTGLLAQGYDSYEASLLGVYLHARAGDFAAEKHSQEAMIAGDIIAELGNVFKEINH
jgi:NAD(P)H-hydrate epimerase